MRWCLAALVCGGADSGGEKKKPVPAGQQAGEGKLARLAKTRVEAAEKAYKAWSGANAMAVEGGYRYSIRWLNAGLDAASKKEESPSPHSRCTSKNRMRDRHKVLVEMGADEPGNPPNLANELDQKEAEYWLERERSAK